MLEISDVEYCRVIKAGLTGYMLQEKKKEER
jgi:hypothetical protein